ncbi:MAG TPA: hypothetical protein VHT96_11255 [Clostridia bacterium]|nr:hypothetical protein [Clostridia bacterium]
MAWASGAKLPGSGKPAGDDFTKPGLYRRLFDKDSEARLGEIEAYARELAGSSEPIKPVNISVTAEIKDYVIYKKLVVKIDKSYKNPLGGLFGLMGKSKTVDISASAVSTVDEPAELIRTTDFIIDIEKKLENKYPGLKNLADKTRNTMSELKQKLAGFLE